MPFKNVDTAKTIAKLLVEKRMAGSVDVLPIRSYHRVNGDVAETPGATIIVKTIERHIQGIEEVIAENYHEEVPCVATIALHRLNREFKDWLINSTS